MKNPNNKKLPYFEQQLEKDMILFKWKSSEKLPRFPEFWLTTNGSLGYLIKEKRWVTGSFTGVLDDYGDFHEFVYHSLNTEDVKTGHAINHEEIIVCGNTPLYRNNEQERYFYANLKEETDRSILCNVLNTRISKALIASSDNQRKQIIQAYKEVLEGAPLVLVTSLLDEIGQVDLTDVKDVDKIQYLTSFYQTIQKRESNDNGIDLENLDKRAQVSTEEIKQFNDYTTMNYLIKYEMRLEFMKEMNENGIDLEIVPNPVFHEEPKEEDVENGTFEEAEAPEEGEQNENENDQGTV